MKKMQILFQIEIETKIGENSDEDVDEVEVEVAETSKEFVAKLVLK